MATDSLTLALLILAGAIALWILVKWNLIKLSHGTPIVTLSQSVTHVAHFEDGVTDEITSIPLVNGKPLYRFSHRVEPMELTTGIDIELLNDPPVVTDNNMMYYWVYRNFDGSIPANAFFKARLEKEKEGK